MAWLFWRHPPIFITADTSPVPVEASTALGLHGWALVFALKWGENQHGLGALCYKMGKIQTLPLPWATTQNTTTTTQPHNNQLLVRCQVSCPPGPLPPLQQSTTSSGAMCLLFTLWATWGMPGLFFFASGGSGTLKGKPWKIRERDGARIIVKRGFWARHFRNFFIY